jgi:hypothetical protein
VAVAAVATSGVRPAGAVVAAIGAVIVTAIVDSTRIPFSRSLPQPRASRCHRRTGHGIVAPRGRRRIADGQRIVARDARAAHLTAEAEPRR